MGNEWKLYWVDEDSELYAARSPEEARAFVSYLTGEPADTLEWGEVTPSGKEVGVNGDTGEPLSMLGEWEKAKAEGIEKPFQFWTSYL